MSPAKRSAKTTHRSQPKRKKRIPLDRVYGERTFGDWSKGRLSRSAGFSTPSVTSPDYRVKMAELVEGLRKPLGKDGRRLTICSIGPGLGHVEGLLVDRGHRVIGVDRFFFAPA